MWTRFHSEFFLYIHLCWREQEGLLGLESQGLGITVEKNSLETEEKYNYVLKANVFTYTEEYKYLSLPFVGTEGEVPGSAVLVFDIELLELVSGLPEGYMFVWNGEVSPNLFEEIDQNHDGEVLLEEVS